ncbi:MAG: hypothetical protein R3B90_17550 [Planctomycetaceae bacterium]
MIAVAERELMREVTELLEWLLLRQSIDDAPAGGDAGDALLQLLDFMMQPGVLAIVDRGEERAADAQPVESLLQQIAGEVALAAAADGNREEIVLFRGEISRTDDFDMSPLLLQQLARFARRIKIEEVTGDVRVGESLDAFDGELRSADAGTQHAARRRFEFIQSGDQQPFGGGNLEISESHRGSAK